VGGPPGTLDGGTWLPDCGCEKEGGPIAGPVGAPDEGTWYGLVA
jgi:hypothetical protein